MKLTLLFLALGIVLFLLGLRFVDPAPPRRIVMATGAAGGAYREFGEQYRTALEREGITVELKETSGSVENLQLLKSGGADVAFVQTGVSGEVADGGLESLASLGFEPLWIFYRGEPLERVSGLRGRRVATGEPGSGTRVLVHRLLKDNAVLDLALEAEIGGAEAAAALREGRVDAACFVAALSAPLIQSLLKDPELQLLSIDRAEAYAARHSWISKLVLPEGVVDLGSNLPRHDVEMVSAVITLVAHDELHPAVAGLLVRTSAAIHGRRGVFEKAGQFPSAEFLEFPMNEDAREHLSHGPSFLSRHLPFWIASAIQRLAILVLPLLTLLIPLLRMAPPIYVWRVRRQIYRWYEKLIRLESRLRQSTGPAEQETRAELLRLDQEVARVRVPLSYMDELYRLRSHIGMVLRSEIPPVGKP